MSKIPGYTDMQELLMSVHALAFFTSNVTLLLLEAGR